MPAVASSLAGGGKLGGVGVRGVGGLAEISSGKVGTGGGLAPDAGEPRVGGGG